MPRRLVALPLALWTVACGDPEADSGARAVARAPALSPRRIFAAPVPRPDAISSTFGPRWKISDGRTDFHPGIDWPDVEGTPVTAIGDGRVEAVYAAGSSQFPLGGNVLVVRHELPQPLRFHGQDVDHLFAVYLHLKSIAVADGQAVTRGQIVAAMGHSGDTELNHLHFEIRLQTMCSLPFQTANPGSSCATGFDPHVHPFLFIPAPDGDQATVDELPVRDGEAYALRYRATRADLDLDVIESDLGALGFDERRGMDAISLEHLDDFRFGWVTVEPAPFASDSRTLILDLRFARRPAFVELRDLDGNGWRIEP